MISDLCDQFHISNIRTAIIKNYDAETKRLLVSVKKAEPLPFGGAETRHPVRSYRPSVIAGKYKGGVFCKLEDNQGCLCIYSYDKVF